MDIQANIWRIQEVAMKRLWVIEATFRSDGIDICDFAEMAFAFTNFYEAHKARRIIWEYLHNISKTWKKNDIKVKEYVRSWT